MSIFTHKILWILLAVYLPACGQEPYYELPPERSRSQAKEVFPNLQIENRKIYIRPEGGLSWQGSRLISGDTEVFEPLRSMGFGWGLFLGVAPTDKWYAEIGYLPRLFQLRGVSKTPYGNFYSANGYSLHGGAFRAARQVVVLDRVGKTTRLYLHAGVQACGRPPALKPLNERHVVLLRPINGGPAPDTLLTTNSLALGNTPILGELGAELRGRVVNRLEIAFFYRVYLQPPSVLAGRYEVKLPYQAGKTAEARPRFLSQQIGLGVQYNFALIKKYKSLF